MSVNKVNKTTGETTIIAGSTLYADAPIGAISPFGGATAPSGWLLCQGQAVSRTDYSELFAVIGTAFGTGDGSTTFNLPDFRSQTPVGVDSRDANLNAIGKTYGEKTHTLTVAEMPSHAHGLNSHTHSIPKLTGTAASNGVHTHKTGGAVGVSGSSYAASMATNQTPAYVLDVAGAGAHTHTVTTNASTTGAASGNTAANGSGNSHNNMQPSTAVNYIIKAKQVIIPSDFEAAIDNAISALNTITSGTTNIDGITWQRVGKVVQVSVVDVKTASMNITGLPTPKSYGLSTLLISGSTSDIGGFIQLQTSRQTIQTLSSTTGVYGSITYITSDD